MTISTHAINSASHAGRYYLGDDNYYTRDQSEEARANSSWFGKGAEALALSGPIEAETFQALLKGELPNGERIGMMKNNQWQHRPGYDITFNVPKSISLFVRFTQDERLKTEVRAAIRDAVKTTLTDMEARCASARQTVKGETTFVETGKLVSALFYHDLSRAGDPHEHIHAVVMNITQRPDGAWRSLSSDMQQYSTTGAQTTQGFFSQVRVDRPYYNMQFWGNLAYRLQELGFTLERTHERGSFEIVGISKASIEAFSTRSQQIRHTMRQQGLSGAAAAAQVTQRTRDPKSAIDRNTLTERWAVQQQLKHVNTQDEVDQLTTQLQQQTTPTKESCSVSSSDEMILSEEQKASATDAVLRSVATLSQTDAVLEHFRLVNLALVNTIGQPMSPAVIEKVMAEQVASGKLVPLPDRDTTAYTTQALLDKETALIKLALTATHPAPNHKANDQQRLAAALHDSALPASAKNIATQLFSNQFLITLIEGIGVNNRENLLRAITQTAQVFSQEVVLLTPHQSGRVVLKAEIPIASVGLGHWFKQHCLGSVAHDTIAQFIERTREGVGRQLIAASSWIIVDQASSQSLLILHTLAQLAKERDAKLVLLGDTHPSRPWQAGCPYQQLIDHGATVISAQEKPKDRMTTLMEKVVPHVIGIKDEATRFEHMVHYYLTFNPTDRSRVLFIAPNRKIKAQLNLAVHAARIDGGELDHATSRCYQVAISGDLPRKQLGVATAWKTGQWLRFHQAYRREKIPKGWCGQIQSTHAMSNQLVLTDNRGYTRTIDPRRFGQNRQGQVQVYQVVEREFSLGENLKVMFSDTRQGIHKGECLTLIDAQPGQFKLARTSGQCVTLRAPHLPAVPIDYGYVESGEQPTRLHQKTHLMTTCHSSAKGLAGKLYHLAKQAEQCTVYTDEKNRLLVNLNAPEAQPSTAIQAALGETIIAQTKQAPGTMDYTASLVAVVRESIERARRQQIFKAGYRPVFSDAELADQAVAFALAHLSEREAAFSQQAIIETAMAQVFGKVLPEAINQAVERAQESGQLIPGIYWYQRHFTTERNLVREQQVVDLVKKEQGTLPPLLTDKQMAIHFHYTPTFQENEMLLHEWFACRDRVLLLQGVAGSGKTTLLENAAKALTGAGYPVTLLAPTNSSVETIRQKGVEAETLARFLEQRPRHQQAAPVALSPTVYIIDEGTLNSTQVNHQFLLTAHQLNARVLIMGDHHQPSGVEAGKDFSLLQRLGVKTLLKDGSYRQQPRPYQQAVQSLYAGQFRDALARITVINAPWTEAYAANDASPNQPLIDQTVGCYFQFSAKARQGILLSTPTNVLRHEINRVIQSTRYQHKELSSQQIDVNVFQNVGWSRQQLSRAAHYQVGQVLYFVRDVHEFGLQAKSYYQIAAIDQQKNALMLSDVQNHQALYQPNGQDIQCYEKFSQTFHVGDRLVMTRHHAVKGKQAAIFFDLLAIEKQTLTLQPLNYKKSVGLVAVGSPQSLDISVAANQHIDLGYCVTIMTAQGLENRISLAAMPAEHPYLTHQKNVLEVITRGVERAIVVTDDKMLLLSTLSHATGEKTSALEAVGHEALVASPKSESESPATESKATKSSDTNLPTQQSTPRSQRLNGQAIMAALTDQTERIAQRLLGEPKKVMGNAWPYGRKRGSLIVTLQGPSRGLWYDHGTGEGGNLLHLIAKQSGLTLPNDYRETLQQAVQLLGQDARYFSECNQALPKTVKQDKLPQYDTHQRATWTDEQKNRIRYAQQLEEQSKPLSGTLAERYLREYRGIQLAQWPKNLRFHPGLKTGQTQQALPALLGIYRNDKGSIRAVQAIFLDPKTGQKVNPNTQPHLATLNKQTFGVVKQGACTLLQYSRNRQEKSYLAEGIETGLTILMANPSVNVHVSLGIAGLANIAPKPLAKNCVICLDNDGKPLSENRPIHRAVEALLQVDKTVSLIMPMSKGSDYNDCLQASGIRVVKEQIKIEQHVENTKELVNSLFERETITASMLVDHQPPNPVLNQRKCHEALLSSDHVNQFSLEDNPSKRDIEREK